MLPSSALRLFSLDHYLMKDISGIKTLIFRGATGTAKGCYCHETDFSTSFQFEKKSYLSPGVWTRVPQSWIEAVHQTGVDVHYGNHKKHLTISARVTSHGCGRRPGSGLLIHIKGNWKRILYTQEFRGTASCWRIFGNIRYAVFVFIITYSKKEGDGVFKKIVKVKLSTKTRRGQFHNHAQ